MKSGAPEVTGMRAWTRWQDWATVLLGVILVATPFVYETTSDVVASWTAFVMGGLMIVIGLFAASMEEPTAGIEGIPLFLGLALFAMPWVLNFTSATEMAWMTWIVATLVALNAAAELLVLPQQTTTA
jgi:hypothetical protein